MFPLIKPLFEIAANGAHKSPPIPGIHRMLYAAPFQPILKRQPFKTSSGNLMIIFSLFLAASKAAPAAGLPAIRSHFLVTPSRLFITQLAVSARTLKPSRLALTWHESQKLLTYDEPHNLTSNTQEDDADLKEQELQCRFLENSEYHCEIHTELGTNTSDSINDSAWDEMEDVGADDVAEILTSKEDLSGEYPSKVTQSLTSVHYNSNAYVAEWLILVNSKDLKLDQALGLEALDLAGYSISSWMSTQREHVINSQIIPKLDTQGEQLARSDSFKANDDFHNLANPTFEFPHDEDELESIIQEENLRLTTSKEPEIEEIAGLESLTNPAFEFPNEEDELELIIQEEKRRLAHLTELDEELNDSAHNHGESHSLSNGFHTNDSIETYSTAHEELVRPIDHGDDILNVDGPAIPDYETGGISYNDYWAPYENESLYPTHTATSPETCFWASYHYEAHQILVERVRAGDFSDDALRRYSLERQAWTHVYAISSEDGYLFPYRALGYRVAPRLYNPGYEGKDFIWQYPKGCKGRVVLEDVEDLPQFYRPKGLKVHGPQEHSPLATIRGCFLPQPSRLSQMMTIDDTL